MEYNEVIVGKEAQNKIKEGINELSEAVLCTMGPSGKTVIIPDKEGGHKVTKDGVSVARQIRFKDPLKSIGAELIKEVAENTVREAGDGTTTSICLANAFINKGYELDLSNNELYNYLNQIEDLSISFLDKIKKPLKNTQIKDVATISANGDTKIGKLIQDAFKHTDLVRVDYSNSNDDQIELINGMELNTGLFDNAFINNVNAQAIDYNNCALIVVEGELINVQSINNITSELEEGTPIIIMADDFPRTVLSVLKNAHNKGMLTLGLIKSPGYAEHRKNLVSDIIKTLCPMSTKGTNDKALSWGIVKGIKSTKYKTTISFVGDETIDKYKKELEDAYKTLKENYEKELMQQRIDNLKGKLANILVGGKSELEAKERYDRVEDAVLATKCALEEGVIEGAGKPLWSIYINQNARNNKNPFLECLKEPLHTINKTTPISKETNLITIGIMDPVKVTKVALRNAISVAKTILGTKAVVL